MRVRAADTPKYARKQTVRDTTMPMGMAFWGFLTSSPVHTHTYKHTVWMIHTHTHAHKCAYLQRYRYTHTYTHKPRYSYR